jgi:hypothetical protein
MRYKSQAGRWSPYRWTQAPLIALVAAFLVGLIVARRR